MNAIKLTLCVATLFVSVACGEIKQARETLKQAESTLRTIENEVIKGRITLEEFTARLNNFLDNSPDEIKQLLRNEVQLITRGVTADIGNEIRCNSGILASHMKVTVSRLIDKLYGRELTKYPAAVICNSNPQEILVSADNATVAFYGAGFPDMWLESKIQLYKDGDELPMVIEARNVIGQLSPTSYYLFKV